MTHLGQLARAIGTTEGWRPFVRAAAIEMVGWPSVNGTTGEVAFADRLRTSIASLPHFQSHPDAVWLEAIPGDPMGRSNVFALVGGRGSRGVVLMGHYDVVSTETYGRLEQLALEPEELRRALIDELIRSARGPEEELALQDLRDGGFLPGRGMLDMKTGLAAGLAVLVRCAEGGEGSVLLVATPDEEAMSRGARAAVGQLAAVAERTGIEFVAAINLDAEADKGDGSRGRAIFLGSVGKMLPAVFLVGRPAHAGTPTDGVNAAYLAATLVADLELSAIEAAHDGQPLAPPTCLCLRDLKLGYDVTLPSTSFVAFNVLFTARSPAEVFNAFVERVEAALGRGLRVLVDRAGSPLAGMQHGSPEVPVLKFAEVADRDADALSATVRSVVLANTPDADRVTWDVAAAERLGVPVINIGPWGRDYHQRLERVHEAYSFETVPELVYRVVHDLLQEEKAS